MLYCVFNAQRTQDMSDRLTSEMAARAVGGRYDLVLIASRRVRELRNGHAPFVPAQKNEMSTALMEVEKGHVGREYLLKAPDLAMEKKRKPR
jgi:DNA-directed RNA polymerase omega subunit